MIIIFRLFLPAAVVIISFQNCSPSGFHVASQFNSEESPAEIPQADSPPVEIPPAATPTSTPTAAVTCRVPRHYRYVLPVGQEKELGCGYENAVDLFNVKIPDKGRAIGRVSAVFKNNNSSTIYFWAAAVVVGNPLASYALGDDICPQFYTNVKQVLGYGTLTATNSTVRALAYQGASPCLSGQVGVWSGAYLDVWVEDDKTECVGQDLSYSSVYMTRGTAPENAYVWKTNMATAVSLPITKVENRSSIRVLTSVEGTPDVNPNNVCGQEAATLVLQSTVAGSISATSIRAIPASMGMGHLVLSTESQTALSNLPRTFKVNLDLGTNTSMSRIFTGGCCGDGVIATIQEH